MAAKKACPLCDSRALSRVLYRDPKALISVAQVKPQVAKMPYSPLGLVQCTACGLVFNAAFNEKKTLPVYASRDFVVRSTIPGAMSRGLQFIFGVIQPFVTPGSRILEIGCGQADLSLALGKVGKKIVTVDPSVNPQLTDLPAGVTHTHIREYFSYDSVKDHAPFDLVVFRHLLEHLPQPKQFLEDVSRLSAENAIVYIEVPNWDNIFDNRRFCDIFNDHFAYYQAATLDQVMAKQGFSLKKSIGIFDSQFMGHFFRKNARAGYRPKRIRKFKPAQFKKFYDNGKKLNKALDMVSSAAVWGAGANGESILSFISERNKKKLKYYFDKDKNKLNKYIPNTRAVIQFPSAELATKVDAVVVAAALYEKEIVSDLTKGLGYTGRVIRLAKGVTVMPGKRTKPNRRR